MSSDSPVPAPAPPRRRRRRVVLAAVLVVVAGLALFREPILEAIPPLLVVSEPEETGDAIVVLAGDAGDRVAHAVELWKAGRSRSGLFVCSGGPIYWKTSWASLMAAHAEALGVPRAKILLQEKSRTTVEDAQFTLAQLPTDVKTIVLVTSAWHSRRAKACFEREAKGRVRVVSCPAPAPVIKEGWWRNAEATRAIVTECLKYLW